MYHPYNWRELIALFALVILLLSSGCQVVQPDVLSAANHPADPKALPTLFVLPTLFMMPDKHSMHPAPMDTMHHHEGHEGHEGHGGHE